MSEIPLDQASGDVTAAAHDAARGKVVYLTEHGERLAAIAPAELAAELESLTPEEFRELLEDFADAQAARESLAEIGAGAKPAPASRSGRNWTSTRDYPAVRAGFAPKAIRSLGKLDRPIAQQIRTAAEALRSDPGPPARGCSPACTASCA